MKKLLLFATLLIGIPLLPSCKKERCLKCTTTINSSSTDHPELCDTDKDLLDAQEEEYKALVADFVNDGWDARVECVRQ